MCSIVDGGTRSNLKLKIYNKIGRTHNTQLNIPIQFGSSRKAELEVQDQAEVGLPAGA